MAVTPVTSSDGNPSAGKATGFHADPLTPGLRLGDAEQVAAERLDGAAVGSLKEALAIEYSLPRVAEPSLVARVEAMRDDAALETSSLVSRPDRAVAVAGPLEALPRPADTPVPHPLQSAAVPLPVSDAPSPSPAPGPAAPLADALGVASQLSADASAAAEALDNLKRMLEQPVSIPGPAPMPKLILERKEPRPAAPPAAVPPPLPPPRAQPMPEPPRAPLPRPRSVPAASPIVGTERARFDVRGFFAGFALSWAIGAVLYLFMTVG